MSANNKRVPWYLMPFYIIWRMFTFILKFTGRLIGAIIGMIFILVGVLLSLTVVGAIIGIPLGLFGLMMVIRSLF